MEMRLLIQPDRKLIYFVKEDEFFFALILAWQSFNKNIKNEEANTFNFMFEQMHLSADFYP